jgi:hypothetical protein
MILFEGSLGGIRVGGYITVRGDGEYLRLKVGSFFREYLQVVR